MSLRYIGKGVTDSNGIAHMTEDAEGNPVNGYTGIGVGKIDLVAKCRNYVSEPYEVTDAIFYDPTTTDRNTDYIINSNYNDISYSKGKYALYNKTATGGYVDVRSLTDSVKGKTIVFSVDLELNGDTVAVLVNVDGTVKTQEFTSNDGVCTLNPVEIPSSASNVYFRVTITSGGISTINFKDWKVVVV